MRKARNVRRVRPGLSLCWCFLVLKTLRLNAVKGGKPSLYEFCDPATFYKPPDQEKEAAYPYDRSDAEHNTQTRHGNLTANIGVVLGAAMKGLASRSFFYLGYGERLLPGSCFPHMGRDVFACHPPVTAEIQALAREMGVPVASNAPTKQATDHSPTMVEIVPNTARDPVEILVSVISRVTDLVLFLLFVNDACVMIRLLPMG